MFKELAPLLQQRSLVILANPLEGDTLRVIVMPKRLNESENAALSTPVSITGTPAELDEQLASTLTQFVGAHLDLKNTLEIAKEEMAQAAKAARQGSKSKTAPKAEASGSTTTKTAESKPAKEETKTAETKKPIPMTANLFDFGATPTAAPVTPAPPPPATAPEEAPDDDGQDEAEVLAEIAEEEQTGEELDPAA